MTDEIAERLKCEYPAPLNLLLISLYDRNKDYWLNGPGKGTIGAENVREHGLTQNQQAFAEAVAEQMDSHHPEFVDFAGVAADEIDSDTSVEDFLDELR